MHTRKWYSVFAGVLLPIFLVIGSTRAYGGQPTTTVMQLAELTPSDGSANDWFGNAIAISGNTVAVGQFDPNTEQYGAVYVYVKPSAGWTNMTQTAKLTSSDNGEGFGTSVAISGNTIVVGAANTSNFDAPAATPGAVYVFVKPAGGWTDMTETAKLTASDGRRKYHCCGRLFCDRLAGKSVRGKRLRVRSAGGRVEGQFKSDCGTDGHRQPIIELHGRFHCDQWKHNRGRSLRTQ
jgi:hypothetical protein